MDCPADCTISGHRRAIIPFTIFISKIRVTRRLVDSVVAQPQGPTGKWDSKVLPIVEESVTHLSDTATISSIASHAHRIWRYPSVPQSLLLS